MNILSNYNNPAKKSIKISESKTIPKQQKNIEYKPDVLDIFADKVVNKRDLSDMVATPRSIFKGYLCFTVGTAINSIASLLKKGKVSKGLSIFGSLISIYGTFNFVKPYLFKNK